MHLGNQSDGPLDTQFMYDRWGQSAGAISASLQMLAYGGNSTGLFRGAFMQSGAPIPVGNITGGQVTTIYHIFGVQEPHWGF